MSTTHTAPRGNRIAYAVIGVFVALCAVGWAIIVAYTEGTPGITAQIVSWRAADHSIRVHYQVTKPKGDEVRCSVVAYDTGHAELGRVQVALPSGTASVDTHQEVPTSSRATAVTVKDCRAG